MNKLFHGPLLSSLQFQEICCIKSSNENTHPVAINRGHYTVARRYEFYVRVARTVRDIVLATRTQNSYLRANV